MRVLNDLHRHIGIPLSLLVAGIIIGGRGQRGLRIDQGGSIVTLRVNSRSLG